MRLLLPMVGLLSLGLVVHDLAASSIPLTVGRVLRSGTAALGAASHGPDVPQEFRARVLEVVDGDTVVLARGRGQVTVRVHGIDAPEGTQPFGSEAKKLLAGLVLNQILTVRMRDMDVYGRVVAALEKDGIDVGMTLIQYGAAWHSRQYLESDSMAAAERQARMEKRGLWASTNPQAPWLFRSVGDGDRPPTRSNTVSTRELHGNRVSKVFHAEGCQHFRCKNCTAIFANREAASAAGYRPHLECVKERP